jgi:hypothetical protein
MQNTNNNITQEFNILTDLIYLHQRQSQENTRITNSIISLARNLFERNNRGTSVPETIPIFSNRENLPTLQTRRSRRTPLISPLFNTSINGLTEQEILDGTEIIQYNSETTNDTICPISFEDFINGEEITKIRFCGHIFKTNSLNNWFRRNKKCPICRHDLSQPTSAATQDTSSNNTAMDTYLTQQISNIFSNIRIPPVDNNNHTEFVFEFPVYYDLSNNVITH